VPDHRNLNGRDSLRFAAGVSGDGIVGIAARDRLENVRARGYDRPDPMAGLAFEILDKAEEEWIRDRDREQTVFKPDRDADALERNVPGDEDNR
jgi:hypothetical protein